MEEYIEYLKGRIDDCAKNNMSAESWAFQESLDNYKSFLDAAKLKDSLHKKHRIMEAGSRQFGKQARFAEMYGMSRPDAYITVCSEEMRDNMEKALTEVMKLEKYNAPIQGRFADVFEKETGITIAESMAMDNTIKLTAMPEMTKPLIPLDKYGKPLELPKSKFHK
jgi:hypothetical protein